MKPCTGEVTDGCLDPEDWGAALTAAFAEATASAVSEAHAEGLAVPGIVDGRHVEMLPDGKVQPVHDPAAWTPTGWRAERT